MNSFLKKAPLHTFLAACLPLLLVYIKNSAAIKPGHFILPAVYISIIVIVAFFSCYFLTRNKKAAFFFTTFTIVSGFYFFRGIQYLIGLIDSENVRDIYSFAGWLILELVVLWWIQKKTASGVVNNSINFLNIFFIALIGIKVVTFLIGSGQKTKLPVAPAEILALKKMQIADSNKVNIYYLLLDECTNSNTLLELFNYKNGFDDSLRNHGFFVSANAKADYDKTFASMSSTLNLQKINPDSISEGYYTQNIVTDLYKKQGYSTEKLTSFFVQNMGKYKSDVEYDPYPVDILENEINSAILVNTAFRIPFKFLFFRHGVDYHVNGIKMQFAIADSLANVKSSKPRLLYIHVNSPHGPLVMDVNGNPDYSYTKNRNSYLAQLIYTQQAVLNTVNRILAAEKGNCIILVQADHGIRQGATPVKLNNPDQSQQVFNAFYFPDRTRAQGLTDSMNISNNFRVILNYQFGSNLEMIQ